MEFKTQIFRHTTFCHWVKIVPSTSKSSNLPSIWIVLTAHVKGGIFLQNFRVYL